MPKRRRLQAARKKSTTQMVKRIDVKLPPGLYKQIQDLMKEGHFFSMSDFGRAAIRAKLAALGSARKK